MLPSVFPLEAMYVSSYSSLERGILQAFCSPVEHPPSGYLPPTHSPSSLPTPLGPSETGCQKLFSQHCGPFHTTDIMPSLHLVSVTSAYLYSCATLIPLDLLSYASVTVAHMCMAVEGEKGKKTNLSCYKAGF